MPAATVQPLQAAGILFAVTLIALAWAGRGRLNSFGLEFVHWNRTSSRVSFEAPLLRLSVRPCGFTALPSRI